MSIGLRYSISQGMRVNAVACMPFMFYGLSVINLFSLRLKG